MENTNKWISVNDELPADDEEVAVTCAYEKFPHFAIGAYDHYYCKWYVQTDDHNLYHPTHWCRLPELPSGE